MTSVRAFVGWISTIIAYLVFLIWVFTPEALLHSYGITYYPSRYYAIALPSYAMVSFVTVIVVYISINMTATLDPDDINTVEDSQTIRCSNEFVRFSIKNEFCVPDIGDMDPSSVSNLLLHTQHPKR